MKHLAMSSKGQVLVIVSFFLVVALILAALAIDIGVAYGVRAKLYAAVDAAAIAAGRVIGQGTEVAKAEAKRFFSANFQAGLLGATASDPVVEPIPNADGSWTINVNSTATVPTRFARIIGWPTITVGAAATSTLRTLDMILILDTSMSLHPSRNPLDPEAFRKLKDAAKKFIGSFDSKYDRIGLVHFASGAVLDVGITDTKGYNTTVLQDMIESLSANGNTTSEEAMRLAKQQLDGITTSARSDVRAIVFFSDGAPNGVASTFAYGPSTVTGTLYSEVLTGAVLPPQVVGEIHQQHRKVAGKEYPGITILPAQDYTGTVNLASDLKLRPAFSYLNTSCNVNMAARNMTENVAYAARDEKDKPIFIFTIGLGDGVTTKMEPAWYKDCGYDNNTESGENILKRLANVSGVDTYNPKQPAGIYAYAANSSHLDSAFGQVASFILRLSK